MVEIRKLTASLSLTGNAADSLGKFGLAVNGVKAGIGLLTDGFKLAKKILFDFTTEVAAQGDEIAKTAKNAALTAEGFQELSFAAELAGSSGKVMAKGIQSLNRNLVEARVKGTGPFADQLKALNINISEFDGLDADEAFEKYADVIKGLPNELEKTAFAQQILGRAGKELIPLLNEGSEGIRKQREEARKLGIFTNEQAAASEALVDAQLRLDKVVESFKITLATGLMPIVMDIIDGTREWLGENDEVIKQKLEEQIAKITSAFETLKPTLQAIGEILVEFPGWLAEISEETVLLVTELKNLDERLSESSTLWNLLKDTMSFTLNPLGALVDKFEGLGDLLGLKLRPEVRGLIDDVKGFLGLVPGTNETVAVRGQGARQVQTFTREARGPGATKNAAAMDRISSGKLSANQLQAIADDHQTSAAVRAAAGEQKTVVETRNARAKAKAARDKKEGKELANAAKSFLGSQFGIFDEKTQTALDRQAAAKAGAARRKELAKNLKGRKGGGKKKGEGPLTDAELLGLINQAGQSGESLTGLIGDRKTPGGVPPVITVTIFQQDVDMDIDIQVNGVPGTSAEEVGNIAAERVSEELLAIIKDAKDNLAPQEGI